MLHRTYCCLPHPKLWIYVHQVTHRKCHLKASMNLKKHATLEQFYMYTHSLLLPSLYKYERPPLEGVTLKFNQNFNQREKHFRTFNFSNYKVGKANTLAKRVICSNNLMPLIWLNLEKIQYKLLYKKHFSLSKYKHKSRFSLINM